MILITYIFSQVLILSIVYFFFCVFTAKPLFLPLSCMQIGTLTLVLWNPLRIHPYLVEWGNLSLPYSDLFLTDVVSTFFFQTFIFIVLSIIFYFISRDVYSFINVNNKPKVITEQALDNLDISYESLDKYIEVNYNKKTYLLYPKKRSLSFIELKEKSFQKQIVREIRQILRTYKKSNRVLGFVGLCLALLLLFYSIEMIPSLL